MGYMLPQVAAHGRACGYHTELYWDDRSDMNVLKNIFSNYAQREEFPDIESHISFGGLAKGPLTPITRLAGVLAGDVHEFFLHHGARIWKSLDPDGLTQPVDPHVTKGGKPFRCMSTYSELLADADPFTGSDQTVMIGAYYKNFMRNGALNYRLISFCDPRGRLGALGIEHGRRWHIFQLSD
jgi:hypothetical protein